MTYGEACPSFMTNHLIGCAHSLVAKEVMESSLQVLRDLGCLTGGEYGELMNDIRNAYIVIGSLDSEKSLVATNGVDPMRLYAIDDEYDVEVAKLEVIRQRMLVLYEIHVSKHRLHADVRELMMV